MAKTTKVVLLAALCALGAVACTERDGPAENLGEQIDDAIDETRDRLEEAGDEVDEAADEIRDALEDN